MNLSDTIAATATAAGESSVSVLRISGTKAFSIIEKIFRKRNGKKFLVSEINSHTVHFGNIANIDEVLVTVFKKPNSYTGEDVIEISCHGGSYLSGEILKLIIEVGARHSEPGEFTRRAFLNGKIDLSQAEAISDLIKVKTESAHNQSLKQLQGNLSRFIEEQRKDLLNIISLVELELDFAEEELEFVNKDQMRAKVLNLKEKVEKIIETYIQGRVIRSGIKLVIGGKPNSGKSSLFNTLLNSERAIVSRIPGTTRDFIEESIIIKGTEYSLMDTAGIRLSEDIIEVEGIKRTLENISSADMILYLIDVTENSEDIKKNLEFYKSNIPCNKTILCYTKCDSDEQRLQDFPEAGIPISIYNLGTIEMLKDMMNEKRTKLIPKPESSEIIITNLRHRLCLEAVVKSLSDSLQTIDRNMPGEFISLDLRNAMNNLSEITGEYTNEDILNNIFSQFCIGK